MREGYGMEEGLLYGKKMTSSATIMGKVGNRPLYASTMSRPAHKHIGKKKPMK